MISFHFYRNSLNFVVEEVQNPSRNLPLAIMFGIPAVTVCYVLTNIGYLAIMSKAEILQSHAVAVVSSLKVAGSPKILKKNAFFRYIDIIMIAHFIKKSLLFHLVGIILLQTC